MEDKSAVHDGLGMEVGRSLGVFYADYGLIGLRDPEWLKEALNVLIGLFYRVELMANIANSKNTTCQPGELHTGMSEEDFDRRSTEYCATYQGRLWCRIPCTDCGVELIDGYMMAYRRCLHVPDPEIDWGRTPDSQTEHLPHVYEFSFPTYTKLCQ